MRLLFTALACLISVSVFGQSLNQEETEDMARFILDIKEVLGITQVLIEHELRFVFDHGDFARRDLSVLDR